MLLDIPHTGFFNILITVFQYNWFPLKACILYFTDFKIF